MIKRPLHFQFCDAVREERKITTIRQKPWPIGVPIMLYNWAGPAYRSKQIDVAAVEVIETMPIEISRPEFGGIHFSIRRVAGRPLWSCEGFKDQDAMDSWFLAEICAGDKETRHLMRFRLIKKLSHP